MLVERSHSHVSRAILPLLFQSFLLFLFILFLTSCNRTPSKPLELKVGVFVFCAEDDLSLCDDPTQNMKGRNNGSNS
jgi:hypothetical protein